ncbi:hypothetical protein LEP1GSC017_0568 [Leptospira meyeri serovar Hardjo str. Went 5]|nr:hypothetical protein LEP1GSC017_0568 [Leptospira meyeri serovar Hardjo str. Went 5]
MKKRVELPNYASERTSWENQNPPSSFVMSFPKLREFPFVSIPLTN